MEKRAIFFRRLLPLLDFGREREGIDLSKVVLTHHTLKARAPEPMSLDPGAQVPVPRATDVGTALVRDRERVLLDEIIARLNDLFQGELTDQDQLGWVCGVLKGKMLESPTLVRQAGSNTKQQFGNSPDLPTSLTNAIIDSLDAHTTMATQALASEAIRRGLLDILLNHADLYESLRARAG